MSINSSLVKLANKIDADGASNVSPEYKNPNNSVEKSLERIADNYEASGGGGTGGGGDVMVVNLTYDEDADDGTFTSSATATEIATANSEGKVVIGKADGNPFFISVVDLMGIITIYGIKLSYGDGVVYYSHFSMDTNTNKWTETLL